MMNGSVGKLRGKTGILIIILSHCRTLVWTLQGCCICINVPWLWQVPAVNDWWPWACPTLPFATKHDLISQMRGAWDANPWPLQHECQSVCIATPRMSVFGFELHLDHTLHHIHCLERKVTNTYVMAVSVNGTGRICTPVLTCHILILGDRLARWQTSSGYICTCL